ncbi:hypothetical protein LTS08_002500 [Lithohypha guttulata]|nr:hypothetical protein LTS08_002500 [Lithohypha guttulata]
MDRFRRRSANIGVAIPSPASERDSNPSPIHVPFDLNAPDSAVSLDQDSKRFATFFGRWVNKSPSASVQPESTNKSKHVLLEHPGRNPLSLSFHERNSIVKSSISPRKPRHVPIIISKYSSPYDPPQQIQSPVLSHCPSLPEILLPVSAAFTTEADATKLGAKPSQSREKEVPSQVVIPQTTMNTSQLSLTASESGTESAASSIRLSHSQSSLAATTSPSPTHQQNVAAANVSGFVCNIHRTTGQEPYPLVGATTTILGDKLYVFGGRVHSRTNSHLSSSLYELDLIRQHWTKLDTTGDIPPSRYFHSVCALGDTKLVCYGGMSPASHQRSPPANEHAEAQPEVIVSNDIFIYDVPTRMWTQIHPAGGDSPQGRYAHCATILPSSAVFASASSHTSAIHHNPPSANPHSGTIGVQIDGTGGAEMIVVGGQDSNNNYIQQISVFNLRNLRWTSSTPYDRNCGAYKSMVTALPEINVQNIGQGSTLDEGVTQQSGTPMLIYSNYNFLDVKLELQVRTPDGRLEEKTMNGSVSPPGLRFPNGGVINGHFVVSGTYLTSSKHEYALWALDLRTLTWAMIDTAGTVFGQGSWNRGILWNRRNAYIILGHRKRNLVDDYNHRRINFAHFCLVELEAYGLYDNPRKKSPLSAYVSKSAPSIPASLQQNLPSKSAGGRKISAVAEQLGHTALYVTELCDMDIIAQNGERISCNSRILSQRWGAFFDQLLLDSALSYEGIAESEATTLRPTMASRAASRISALTITPSTNTNGGTSTDERSYSRSTQTTLVDLPSLNSIPAAARGRALYLPHMVSTIKLMLHFLYTSALPSVNDPLCSVHTLCSLLQLARPYQIDGLLEATMERLHEVLDGRNAAAVFNAAAMAAGGGRANGYSGHGTLEALERRESVATMVVPPGLQRGSLLGDAAGTMSDDRNRYGERRGHGRTGSGDSTSTATSGTTSTTFSQTDTESPIVDEGPRGRRDSSRQIWNGELSSVIGLQKRGLRGLMEGRRLRERANTSEG